LGGLEGTQTSTRDDIACRLPDQSAPGQSSTTRLETQEISADTGISRPPSAPAPSPPPAQPFIKCAGGKRYLAGQLISLFPERFGAYYEPCTRAGNLRGLLAFKLSPYPADGVIVLVRYPLFERDDRIVSDMNVLRADLGAALGDIAHVDPGLVLEHL
jgi:hypothetical protein